MGSISGLGTKIPHVMAQLNPLTATTEACVLRSPKTRAAAAVRSLWTTTRKQPHPLQPEKGCLQPRRAGGLQRRPSTAKKKISSHIWPVRATSFLSTVLFFDTRYSRLISLSLPSDDTIPVSKDACLAPSIGNGTQKPRSSTRGAHCCWDAAVSRAYLQPREGILHTCTHNTYTHSTHTYTHITHTYTHITYITHTYTHITHTYTHHTHITSHTHHTHIHTHHTHHTHTSHTHITHTYTHITHTYTHHTHITHTYTHSIHTHITHTHHTHIHTHHTHHTHIHTHHTHTLLCLPALQFFLISFISTQHHTIHPVPSAPPISVTPLPLGRSCLLSVLYLRTMRNLNLTMRKQQTHSKEESL